MNTAQTGDWRVLFCCPQWIAAALNIYLFSDVIFVVKLDPGVRGSLANFSLFEPDLFFLNMRYL